MPELLKTKRIGSELEELIVNAKKYICIFSFSLKIDRIYLERLKAASKRGVGITVVFGVEPRSTEILSILSKIEGCKIYYKEYMHAKFYYNEDALIITSMNMSEVSEERNYELGILFKKQDYPKIFEKIKVEAREIVHNANQWPPTSTVKPNPVKTFNIKPQKNEKHLSGVCIRCGINLKYNPFKPLCTDCYEEWEYWENDFYEENYCHCCGKEKDDISYARPECNSCYKNENYILKNDWTNELSSRLFSELKKECNIKKDDGALIITSPNKYEVFITKEKTNVLIICGILSVKEFRFAQQNKNLIKTNKIAMELVSGNSENYNSVWGRLKNLKSNSIFKIAKDEEGIITDGIVKFITSIEKLRPMVK